VPLGGDLGELGGGDGQRGAGVVHPEQGATTGQHHLEVLAGATRRVQHPAARREPRQESLHEPLVGGLDLAPLGVVVAGQGVLLSLVDPPAVPQPSPSVSRRGGARLSVAHAMTNSSLDGGSSSDVVHLRANSVHLAEMGSRVDAAAVLGSAVLSL
jgi:hypothetical protein